MATLCCSCPFKKRGQKSLGPLLKSRFSWRTPWNGASYGFSWNKTIISTPIWSRGDLVFLFTGNISYALNQSMLFFIIDLYTEKKSQAGRNVTLPPAAVGVNVTLWPAAAHNSPPATCHSSGLTKMASPPPLPSGSQYIQHMYSLGGGKGVNC